MTRPRRFVAVFVAALVVAIAAIAAIAPVRAQAPRVVGVITELAGPVYLRPSVRGAEVPLDQKADVGRALEEGQALRAGAGGRATIVLATGTERITPSRGRFELRYVEDLSDAQRRLLSALNDYGRPGGSRGVGSRIHAPADQSVVRLDHLDVRWTPDDGPPLTMELRTLSRRVVWSTSGLPSSAGRLANSAIAALANAIRQAEGDRAGATPWTLVLRNGSMDIAATTFRTLSRSDSEALSARLREIEGLDAPLVRAIARVSELNGRSLYNEAADEWDRLLASTPGSTAISQAAIGAHERIGDAAAVRRLAEPPR
jgi:hypothetical protein